MKKFVSLVILAVAGFSLLAQDKVNSLKLDMKENADAPGTLVAGAEGRANAAGQYIRINVPDMFRPLLITVLADKTKKPLKISLHGESWKTADMSKETDQDGYCEFKIRAQDAVGVKLVCEEGTDYLLMAYLGKEITPELPTPFTDKNKKKEASVQAPAQEENTTQGGSLTYILIGVGAVIVVLLLILIRRVNAKKTISMLLLMISVGAYAQTELRGKTDAEIRAEAEKAATERGNKEIGEKWKGAGEKAEKAAKILVSGKELWDSYKNLNTCMAGTALPGMPSVPSFCDVADSNDNRNAGVQPCAECFKEARREFNEVRYKFIKLQTIYRCTKSFADKAKSFGDDVSSIHAVQGLAWQAEKRKIEQSMDRLKKSYDDKYIDLLQRLHNAMMKLDECEGKFGQKNWFDSYGFIFYEFMKESYRRKDE